MRVLIAIDGSDYSDLVIKNAAQRSWPDNTELRVLSVFEPAPYGTELFFDKTPALPYPQVLKRLRHHTLQLTERAAAQLAGPGRIITNVIREGSPAQEIINEAQQWSADLIMLGSHGHSQIARLILGSVTVRVKSHAPCPVEVIHKEHEKIRRAGAR